MEMEEDSHQFRADQNPVSENRRPPLLYTCGASFLTMVHKTYQRAERSRTPLGPLSRTLASIANPITDPLEHQWLLILSFIDSQLLGIEKTIMGIFPPSEHIFNKLDDLAFLIEGLPMFLDDVIDHIPALLHQLPLFDWATGKTITVLKFLVTTITHWNSSNEREIMVDVKCNEPNKVCPEEEAEDEIEDDDNTASPSLSEEPEVVCDEKFTRSIDDDIREVENTCKQVIEALEEMEIIEHEGIKGSVDKLNLNNKKVITESREHGRLEDIDNSKGSILELFEEGWGGKKGL